MEKITAWLAGSPTLNLIFLILALVSFLASIYFYIKSKRDKVPVYLAKTFPLIKDNIASIDGLGIFYNGTPIKSLYLTRIAFWNSGRETINRADITGNDPARITSETNNRVLGAKLSYSRRPANDGSIEKHGEDLYISFDFLDQDDGLIVDVYHTSDSKLKVSGTIKGSGKISQAIDNPDHYSDLLISPYRSWIRANIKAPTIKKALIILAVFFLLPAIFMTTALDNVARLFRRIPAEYKLTE